MNKRKCSFLYTCFLNVKMHVQVHFTVASQFYVYVNVDLYVHTFMHLYGGEKTGMLNFLLVSFHGVRGFWRQILVYTLLTPQHRKNSGVFPKKFDPYGLKLKGSSPKFLR